jgi:hypothetical protein
MQPVFDFHYLDLKEKRVLIGLSGGINSMAALVYLGAEYPIEYRPRQIWLYYAHLDEHSPDTMRFVRDGIAWAEQHCDMVHSKIERAGSVLDFFERENIIPHPIISPCSEHLKFGPMAKYADENQIEVDLIGFIRTEKNRIRRQQKRGAEGKIYPISHLSDQDCFDLVDQYIGWHPAIYDIRDEAGKQVFLHNNCLPCKNMQGRLDGCSATGDFLDVQKHYPEYFQRARDLSVRMGAYWGREAGFDGHCKLCED